jgi:hypothetical protein
LNSYNPKEPPHDIFGTDTHVPDLTLPLCGSAS